MARLSPSQSLDVDITVPATTYDPELVLFADGTQVVMRAAVMDLERFGVTIGCSVEAKPYPFQAVKWEDGTTDHVAPHVLHRVEVGDVVLAALTAKPGATAQEVLELVRIHRPAVCVGTVVGVLSTAVRRDQVRTEGEPDVRRYFRI